MALLFGKHHHSFFVVVCVCVFFFFFFFLVGGFKGQEHRIRCASYSVLLGSDLQKDEPAPFGFGGNPSAPNGQALHGGRCALGGAGAVPPAAPGLHGSERARGGVAFAGSHGCPFLVDVVEK